VRTTAVVTVEDRNAAWRELTRRNERCDGSGVIAGYIAYVSFHAALGSRPQVGAPNTRGAMMKTTSSGSLFTASGGGLCDDAPHVSRPERPL